MIIIVVSLPVVLRSRLTRQSSGNAMLEREIKLRHWNTQCDAARLMLPSHVSH